METLEKLEKLIKEVIPGAIYLGGWKITPETKIKQLLGGSNLNEYFLTTKIQEEFKKTPELKKMVEKTINDLADWLRTD